MDKATLDAAAGPGEWVRLPLKRGRTGRVGQAAPEAAVGHQHVDKAAPGSGYNARRVEYFRAT